MLTLHMEIIVILMYLMLFLPVLSTRMDVMTGSLFRETFQLQTDLISAIKFSAVFSARSQTSVVMSFLRTAVELESLMKAIVAWYWWSSYWCLVSMPPSLILASLYLQGGRQPVCSVTLASSS